jgi:predicted transcriptional regulator
VHGLGDLESVVMDRLWRWARPATVREVVDDLRQERSLAYTTVQTVMENLVRKGWLARETQGRAHTYAATIGREAAVARLMREALADSSDHSAVFAHFVAEMDAEEAQALRAALRRQARRGPL